MTKQQQQQQKLIQDSFILYFVLLLHNYSLFFALQNLVHVPVLRQDDLPLHLIHHDRDTAHPLR